jgi:hypothetical protein
MPTSNTACFQSFLNVLSRRFARQDILLVLDGAPTIAAATSWFPATLHCCSCRPTRPIMDGGAIDIAYRCRGWVRHSDHRVCIRRGRRSDRRRRSLASPRRTASGAWTRNCWRCRSRSWRSSTNSATCRWSRRGASVLPAGQPALRNRRHADPHRTAALRRAQPDVPCR